MNLLTASQVMKHTGLNMRRFQWWRHKGYIKPTMIPGIRKPRIRRYSLMETFIVSVIKEVVDNTRISIQRSPEFRKTFEDLIQQLNLPDFIVARQYLIIISHKPAPPIHPHYDMILCGAPMALSQSSRKLYYYTIDLKLHWPKLIPS